MNYVRTGKFQSLFERDYVNPDGSVLPVLYFPLLEKDGIAQHFFTTRVGGVSRGFLSSLNLGTTRGDDKKHLDENYKRVAAAFHTDGNHIVTCHQTHSTNVLRVDARSKISDDADGLVTNEPGIVLGILVADCVPVLFVDPVHRAVGACHSGWKGTVGRIGAKTVMAMHNEFGSDPSDILAGIGPSICQNHYEVSEEVADHFKREFPGYESEILQYAGNPGHFQLDLWSACKITLEDAGVLESNIRITDICTACNPDLLFSHRASHGKRGNIGAFIMLVGS